MWNEWNNLEADYADICFKDRQGWKRRQLFRNTRSRTGKFIHRLLYLPFVPPFNDLQREQSDEWKQNMAELKANTDGLMLNLNLKIKEEERKIRQLGFKLTIDQYCEFMFIVENKDMYKRWNQFRFLDKQLQDLIVKGDVPKNYQESLAKYVGEKNKFMVHHNHGIEISAWICLEDDKVQLKFEYRYYPEPIYEEEE